MTYEIKIAARLGIAKSLQNLLDQNINGIRGIKYITDELDTKFINEVTLLNNDNFKLEFDKATKELNLKTTWSGQLIDDNFINQMKIIDGQKGSLLVNCQMYLNSCKEDL